MAKGKSSSSSSKGIQSAGIHRGVSRATTQLVREGYRASGERVTNQRNAFDSGKRVMVTIPNPNPNETNKLFIRVSAKDANWKTKEFKKGA